MWTLFQNMTFYTINFPRNNSGKVPLFFRKNSTGNFRTPNPSAIPSAVHTIRITYPYIPRPACFSRVVSSSSSLFAWKSKKTENDTLKKVKVHPYSQGECWAGSWSPSKAMQPSGVQSTWNQGRWPRLAPVLRLPSQYSTVISYCRLTATHFAYPGRMRAWVELARPGDRTRAFSMTLSIQPHRQTINIDINNNNSNAGTNKSSALE